MIDCKIKTDNWKGGAPLLGYLPVLSLSEEFFDFVKV